ncbi:MAG: rod shape-determining protein [Candidatus Parcubacteria bacterium]|nr:MAG: rod shape-determining protein [Candidatus Parcubacteria bacterium]
MIVKIKSNLLIGVDLGTAYTKVYLKEIGMVTELPTVIAFNNQNNSVIAIGDEAKNMLGRNPQNINVVRPILKGVVTHFDEALVFLEKVIEKIKKEYLGLFGIKMVIGVPLDLTEVQKKGVIDVALGCGVKKVFLVEEPMAAALGANLDIEEARGVFIVDIGGGTTDIALISLGGVVIGRSIRIGGDTFNLGIVNHIKSKYNLVIGERQAEEAKISVSNILVKSNQSFVLKGRDIITGLPKEVTFHSSDLRESILEDLEEIVNVIKDILNLAPPDLLGDISENGIYLAGGGSLIHGIDSFIEKEVKLKINVIEEPKYSVIRGIGKILEDLNHYQKLLINVSS